MNSTGRSSRRQMLEALSGFGAVAFFGCGSNASDTGGAGGAEAGAAGVDGALTWATDGTSVLTGKDYGNPFASGIGSTCSVYKASTAGPCHATSDKLVRKDVSEGYPGLPMRLELLVVDASCAPVPDATVEIWMCDTKGVYFGDIDGNNDAFCTGGSATAAAALWGRGIQTADADGRILRRELSRLVCKPRDTRNAASNRHRPACRAAFLGLRPQRCCPSPRSHPEAFPRRSARGQRLCPR